MCFYLSIKYVAYINANLQMRQNLQSYFNANYRTFKREYFLSYVGTKVNKDTYADAFMKVAATL